MSLSAAERLALIHVKTKRAEKHLRDLEGLAESTRGLEDYAFISDENGKLTYQRLPVVEFGVIAAAGDVLHNLRTALDHLAWQLVLANRNVPTRHTGFPIAESPSKLVSIFRKKVAGMRPEAKKAIKDLRPYNGGNDPLWRIHYLDIVDKHKELLIVGNKHLFRGDHFLGEFFAQADEAAHFPGIYLADTHTESQSPVHPSAIKLEIPGMEALIPSMHQLLVFTAELIDSFAPCLGP